MPRLHLLALVSHARVLLGETRTLPVAEVAAAADACQTGSDRGDGEQCAAYMLQSHARFEKRETRLGSQAPIREPELTRTVEEERRSAVVCPVEDTCTLEDCCPKAKDDCIKSAHQVEQIMRYLLRRGSGAACTDHVNTSLGVEVTADNLCVSSNLVLGTQVIIKDDPGRCLPTMYQPTTLAPQLGCNPWAWFSDASGVLSFLSALYRQSDFLDVSTVSMDILQSAGALTSPQPTVALPVKWGRIRIFDRTLAEGVPTLMKPNPATLIQGPGPYQYVYSVNRTASPFIPLPKFRQFEGPWWQGADVLMTQCPAGQGQPDVCKNATKVLESLSQEATRALLVKNHMEITKCPWARSAQAPRPNAALGPQKTDGWNFLSNVGTYSCPGGKSEAWTCLICPDASQCVGPNADLVSANFEGCGLAEAERCYPVPWFGNPINDAFFPTQGCSKDWLHDMFEWLANPRAHLARLANIEVGQVTAVQAVNTLMFVFGVLFTSGHSGWRAGGSPVHTDAQGNPTCSIVGASKKAGAYRPGTGCGEGNNLPCCGSRVISTGDQGVRFATQGPINMEYITENAYYPQTSYPCMKTIDVCGPVGVGPPVKLADGSLGTFECSPGA